MSCDANHSPPPDLKQVSKFGSKTILLYGDGGLVIYVSTVFKFYQNDEGVRMEGSVQ